MNEVENIRFSYTLLDPEDEDLLEDDDEDEVLVGTFSALVARLDGDLFRVAEPVSMTPFGPWGPRLNIGDIIEAIPEDEGRYRYVRRVEGAKVANIIISPMRKPTLQLQDVAKMLDRFRKREGYGNGVQAISLSNTFSKQERGTSPKASVNWLTD